MTRKEKIPKLALSAIIVVLTVVGAVISVTSKNKGLLSAYGAENFKFFTVDSNLLLGLSHLLYFILAAAGVTDRSQRACLWTERLLYITTVSVGLTFTVVVFGFAPFIGLRPLIQDSNLYFHLIIPVLAIVGFCALHRGRLIPLGETVCAIIPPFVYGVYYTADLLIRGVHFPETDWYGFTNGGVVGSVLVACGIFLLTWVLALLIRLLAGGTARAARRRLRHAEKREV